MASPPPLTRRLFFASSLLPLGWSPARYTMTCSYSSRPTRPVDQPAVNTEKGRWVGKADGALKERSGGKEGKRKQSRRADFCPPDICPKLTPIYGFLSSQGLYHSFPVFQSLWPSCLYKVCSDLYGIFLLGRLNLPNCKSTCNPTCY